MQSMMQHGVTALSDEISGKTAVHIEQRDCG
jgi:hypothetical protein